MNNLLTDLFSGLLGSCCELCGDTLPAGTPCDLCNGCVADLPWNTRPCRHCALPLPPGREHSCQDCDSRPPPWLNAHAPLVYAPPIASFIQRLKFSRHLPSARLLGQLFATRPPTGAPLPDLAIPVPLHASRQRERGFNQALEILRPISRQLGIPLSVTACQRVIATPEQSRLTATQRRRNLRGAFVCDAQVQGRHIALFDDVVTTGSTVAELTRCLHAGGAASVTVWCCARVPVRA